MRMYGISLRSYQADIAGKAPFSSGFSSRLPARTHGKLVHVSDTDTDRAVTRGREPFIIQHEASTPVSVRRARDLSSTLFLDSLLHFIYRKSPRRTAIWRPRAHRRRQRTYKRVVRSWAGTRPIYSSIFSQALHSLSLIPCTRSRTSQSPTHRYAG